jgi:hypothetical protein
VTFQAEVSLCPKSVCKTTIRVALEKGVEPVRQ